jgi:hypothetical protein
MDMGRVDRTPAPAPVPTRPHTINPHTHTRKQQAQIQQWADPSTINPALTLPKANDFIPTDFALRADAPQYQVYIYAFIHLRMCIYLKDKTCIFFVSFLGRACAASARPSTRYYTPLHLYAYIYFMEGDDKALCIDFLFMSGHTSVVCLLVPCFRRACVWHSPGLPCSLLLTPPPTRHTTQIQTDPPP